MHETARPGAPRAAHSASSRLAAAVAAARSDLPGSATTQPTPQPTPRSRACAQTAAGPAAPPWQLTASPGQQLILMPGQMCFDTTGAQLRTLLGSCVSITLWHPARRIGGMCHYLLPGRQRSAGEPPDGRYGDEALAVMVERLRRAGTRPEEYVAHLYGGADTLPEVNGLKFNVGERNIERGWTLIDHYGFQLDGVDVGEDVPRTVSIDLASGVVLMRRGAGKAPLHPELAARPAV